MALKLSLIHLQLVLELERTRSLTAAARSLRLTTPAVSYRLNDAERRVGKSLFERHGHDWQLTHAGERVIQAAKIVVGELLAMEAELKGELSERPVALRVGARGYSAYRWLPAFAREFAADQPAVRMEIVDDSKTSALESLRDRHVDVAIAAGHIRPGWAVVTPLFRDELVAVLPVGHPLASRPWLEPQDFMHEPYITYSASAERGHEGDQFFRDAGIPKRNRVEVGLAEAVIEWVRFGFGLSVLTSWALVEHVRSGLVATRPLTKSGLMLDWCAVVRREAGNQLSLLFAQKLARWCATYPLFIGQTHKAPRRLKGRRPRRKNG